MKNKIPKIVIIVLIFICFFGFLIWYKQKLSHMLISCSDTINLSDTQANQEETIYHDSDFLKRMDALRVEEDQFKNDREVIHELQKNISSAKTKIEIKQIIEHIKEKNIHSDFVMRIVHQITVNLNSKNISLSEQIRAIQQTINDSEQEKDQELLSKHKQLITEQQRKAP